MIPTDKPSRLYYNNNDLELQFCELCKETTPLKENRNIYITSAEEITDGDWGLSKLNEVILFGINYNKNLYKKIILTTDTELIADGVQTIEDEFLQWFVKNPSCEEIGVLTNNMKNADYIEVAERLYKYINPTSKMDCPNSVYITTEKWYYEWLNIETDLDLFDWCVKFKNK